MKKIALILTLLISVISYAQTTSGEYTIINTSEANTNFSDFGPAFFGENKIIFASSRGNILQKKWDNNQPFLNLYQGTIQDNGSINTVKILSTKVNTQDHESSVAFSPDLKTVYFTRNNVEETVERIVKDSTALAKLKDVNRRRRRGDSYKEKLAVQENKSINIALYKATINFNGNWTNIKLLPFNSKNYSVGSPSVNNDGSKLYFSSDMPGTYGKTDIFVVDILANNKFSKPRNLGKKINTIGRENFPFIDSKNVLYYASDSKSDGFGGLDIYATKIYGKSTSKSLHLGEPINSKADDFGYIINNNTDEGYLSTNRKGGKGDDDIYHVTAFVPLNFECTKNISGIVKNEKTNKPIPNALVVLKNDNNTKEVKTNARGVFKLLVNCDTDFRITASKEDFEIDYEEFVSTTKINYKKKIKLNLQPIRKCRQSVSGIVKNKLNNKKIGNVFIKIIDKKGRDQYSTNTNKNGSFTVNLPCETGYTLIASKDKFSDDTRKLVTEKNPINTLNLTFNLNPELDLTEVSVVRDRVIVNIEPIYFDLNRSDVNLRAAIELDKVVTLMNKYPKLKMEGGSHTDARGPKKLNIRLSNERANSTVEYIIENGISPSRISAKGYGESQPVNGCVDGVNCSETLHKQNRRTEFVILNPEILGYVKEE